MKPEDGSSTRDNVLKNALAGIAYRTGALVIVLLIGAILIGSVGGLPVIFPGLSFLLFPLIAGAILLYVSSIVPLFLGGKLTGPICSSLNLLTVFVFLALVMATDGVPVSLKTLALPILVTGSASSLYVLGISHSVGVKTITRALLIAAAGYLAMSMPGAFGLPDAQIVGTMLFAGFGLASLTSLIGLFKGHSNEYLACAGNLFNQWVWPASICLLCIVLLVYDHYVKPTLVSLISGGVVIIEWSVLIVVFAYVSLIIIKTVRWNSQGRVHGDLHTLIQQISYDKQSLEVASAAVDGFVKAGKKEGLIVYLSTILITNKASQPTIERVISGIVNYSDEPEPHLALKWAVGDLAGKNRKRRLAMVNDAISTAADAVGYSSAAERFSQPVEKPLEDLPVLKTR